MELPEQSAAWLLSTLELTTLLAGLGCQSITAPLSGYVSTDRSSLLCALQTMAEKQTITAGGSEFRIAPSLRPLLDVMMEADRLVLLQYAQNGISCCYLRGNDLVVLDMLPYSPGHFRLFKANAEMLLRWAETSGVLPDENEASETDALWKDSDSGTFCAASYTAEGELLEKLLVETLFSPEICLISSAGNSRSVYRKDIVLSRLYTMLSSSGGIL